MKTLWTSPKVGHIVWFPFYEKPKVGKSRDRKYIRGCKGMGEREGMREWVLTGMVSLLGDDKYVLELVVMVA